jgi:hypothetical protein
LAVTLCVITKTLQCLVVVFVMRRAQPLVTLGDAIESFICRPCIETPGMCLVGQLQAREARGNIKNLVPGPRQTHLTYQRRRKAVPAVVWISTYLLLLLSVGLVGYLFAMSIQSPGL